MPFRRIVALTSFALLLIFPAAWWALDYFATEVHLDIVPSEIQKSLSAKFPVKGCAPVLGCIELSSPVVALSEGSDRIGFSSAILVSRGSLLLPGQVAFTGKVRYVRYAGEFYFDDIEIQTLQFAGVPPAYTEAVKVRAPGILRAALQNHPVYTIKGDTEKERLAKLAISDVKVVNGKLRVTFKLAKG